MRHLAEALVIFACHCKVHVVVPRNKVLMSYRAKKRSAVKEILYIMFFAKLIKSYHYFKKTVVDFVQSISFIHINLTKIR